AQGFIVQRLNVQPFFLLKLAIPLLVIAFLLMAIFETRAWLTIAMIIQGFAMGLAGPGFMAGTSLAVKITRARLGGRCGSIMRTTWIYLWPLTRWGTLPNKPDITLFVRCHNLHFPVCINAVAGSEGRQKQDQTN
ncbi:MAG: hypothetical protein VYA08_12125, partial [Pseudomonadota bacterium]|nr:hypothetical protein [Pseudomonadota bacterium]